MRADPHRLKGTPHRKGPVGTGFGGPVSPGGGGDASCHRDWPVSHPADRSTRQQNNCSNRLPEDLVALGEPGLFVGTQPKHLHATEGNAAFAVSKPGSLECNLSATEIFRRGKEARRRRCQSASQRSADAAFGGKDRSGGWSRSRIVRAAKSRSG